MMQMKGITKVYRTDVVETRALQDLSLTIEQGEFVAVTGPSGSGKTTFLNIAGLLETFEQGTYLLDDRDVSQLKDREPRLHHGGPGTGTAGTDQRTGHHRGDGYPRSESGCQSTQKYPTAGWSSDGRK